MNKQLEQIQESLAQVMVPDAIPKWLNTPNQAFGDVAPMELIQKGETDQIYAMIYYLMSGSCT